MPPQVEVTQTGSQSALQHLMDEVRRLIARGIPEPAIV
jgi:hypothetical protein